MVDILLAKAKGRADYDPAIWNNLNNSNDQITDHCPPRTGQT